MLRRIVLLFLISFSLVFGKSVKQTPLEAYNKFKHNSPKYYRLKLKDDEVDLDMHELLYNLIKVESNFKPMFNKYANGICQIESSTFKAMYTDRRFIKKRKRIEKEFNVDVRNYKKYHYSNIVAAYCVLVYKAEVSPHLYRQYKKRIKRHNNDEWYVYKLYYNSPKGKTSYKRWTA